MPIKIVTIVFPMFLYIDNIDPSIKDITSSYKDIGYSKTGESIKITIWNKVYYVKSDKLNSMDLTRIGNNEVMLFDTDFDSEKVLSVFLKHYIDNCEIRIAEDKKRLIYYNSFLLEN